MVFASLLLQEVLGVKPRVETDTTLVAWSYAMRGQMGDLTTDHLIVEIKKQTTRTMQDTVLAFDPPVYELEETTTPGLSSTDLGFRVQGRVFAQLFAEADGHLWNRGHRTRVVVASDVHVSRLGVHDVVEDIVEDADGRPRRRWRNRFRMLEERFEDPTRFLTVLRRLHGWVTDRTHPCTLCRDGYLHRPKRLYLEPEELKELESRLLAERIAGMSDSYALFLRVGVTTNRLTVPDPSFGVLVLCLICAPPWQRRRLNSRSSYQ